MKVAAVTILAAATGANAVLTLTAGNAQSIIKDAAVAYTGITPANSVCWKPGTSAPTLAVADCPANAGTATAFGTSTTGECSAAGAAGSITWNTVTQTHIALIECSGTGTGVGTATQLVLTNAATTTAPVAAASGATTAAVATGAACLTAAALAILV